ncbi:unnamed protein product [Adineta ricciae]|uniref:RING-CH-type domain-containing protein n=1 Tax=Adineta ricciae TaxID=249248 RepID=A0A814N0X2_ADIRI|nr:unnamed protein product [Adineta ricciae]
MITSISSSESTIRTCRICLDSDHPTDLISPCLCTGGSAFVHRKCLDKWRATNKSERVFHYCDVCQFQYVIEPVVADVSADRRRLLIFRLLVTRDILLIVLLIQAFLVGLTFLVQYCDRTALRIKKFYPDSMAQFGVYYLSSLIIFFALLGVIGLIMASCGMLNSHGTAGSDDCHCFCGYFLCCDDGDNCGEGIIVFLLIAVIIFAVLGVFFGIIFTVIITKKIAKHHTKKLWLRQETKKYVVKDFQGRRDELQQVSSQRNTHILLTEPQFAITNRDKQTSTSVELISIKKLQMEND